MTDKNLLAQLEKLPADKREALLKKLKAKKKAQAKAQPQTQDIAIERVNRDSNTFEMSFAQQRLWFLDRLDSSTAFYNLAAAIELNGALNIAALEQALANLIKRHETLRTTFAEEEGRGQQIIHAQMPLQLPQIDISQSAAESRSQELKKLVEADAQYIFDLSSGPLIKTTLVKLANDQYQLLLTMHHIIADGWSAQVFAQELSQFYAAIVNQQVDPLGPLNVQYIDYSAWQKQQLTPAELEKQYNFWAEHLADSPSLELPYDYPRPSVQTYNGKTVELMLTQAQLQQLQQVAQQQQTTLFVVVLSAYYLLLHKLSGSSDLVLGTPVANRTRTELESIIGFFVNTLCLRAKLSPNMMLSEVIEQVKQTSIAAQNHQDLPFERLVEQLNLPRDPALSPLFQTFFSLDKGAAEQALQLPGVTAKFRSADIDAAKFDFSLIASETSNGIRCLFEYNTDLFARQSIENFAQLFSAIVDCIDSANLTSTQLQQLPSATAAQQQRLLEFARSQQRETEASCLQSLIERQVEQSPGAIACSDRSGSLSYRQLNQQANRLAHFLRQQGVKTNSKVGICLAANNQALTAILAVIKAGGAYVPMDVNYPAERLKHMVDNADMQLVISHSDYQAQFAALDHSLYIDTDSEQWQDQSTANPDLLNSPEDALYTIYTSGSTGLPKGALVRHRNSVNLLDWYCREYNLNAQDKVLIISALGFDLTQKNLFALLTQGGSVVFPELEVYDPNIIAECVQQHQISLINCAPSAFYPLAQETQNWPKLVSLRCVLFGGEAIQLAPLQAWLGQTQCQLINMYGPTECTDIAASYALKPSDLAASTLPIGSANDNVELYVLNEQQQLVCPGVIGELYIGGAGVGLGYINNPEQTAQAFIANPFSASGEPIYRTGDLVRLNTDQQLEFVSRVDGQVKIRGFRIELGEIEAVLKAQSGVQDAVVAAKTGPQGNDVLVAYLQLEDAELTAEQQQSLQQSLVQNLPAYMVPQAFLRIDSVPLTANGKVDRKILAEPEASDFNQTEYVAPSNDEEQTLVDIWQDILQLDRVGTADNFFEAGGHSLLATQLSSRISDSFGLELPVKTIFEIPTIAGLANLIRSLSAPVAASDNEMEEGLLLGDEDDFEEGVL